MRFLLLTVAALALVALIAPQETRRLLQRASYGLAGPPPFKPSRGTLTQPEPLRITVDGTSHELRLDALQRFGATGRDDLCADQSDEGRANACGKEVAGFRPGDAALLQAVVVLHGAGSKPAAERFGLLRDANGLVLMGLRSGAFAGVPNLPAFAYEDLADQADDGRVHEIAAELAVASAEFCKRDDEDCRMRALRGAGKSLVAAGRWFNDAVRLTRAGELLSSVISGRRNPLEASDRFDINNDIGNAYSYASPFATSEQRLALMEKAVSAYEAELPYADERAPSFSSAKLWQNLGAAYVDRGVLTGSKEDFERGLLFYEKSLPLFDRERFRQSWARAKSNMGAARSRLATAARDLAMHDLAARDHEDSIAAFEDGQERLDVAFSRYRLARSLSDKARTADDLATGDGGRRAEMAEIAARSRKEALPLLAEATETFRRSGSSAFLARVEGLTTEIRRALPAE